MQPWCTAFPTWNQSIVPCLVLTVASWPAYRFLRRRVRWSVIPISLRISRFVVIHTIKGFSIANDAEVVVFLEFPCFLCDTMDAGNLISGSSAFSKSSLYIWKFLVHVLLKTSLKDLDYCLDSMWKEHNWIVVCIFFALPFFGIRIKTDFFQSCGHCWVFQICWHIECRTFTASSFRIWNSSAGIPSPPLALVIVMLLKVLLTSHPRMSAIGEWLLWIPSSDCPCL